MHSRPCKLLPDGQVLLCLGLLAFPAALLHLPAILQLTDAEGGNLVIVEQLVELSDGLCSICLDLKFSYPSPTWQL